TTTTGMRDSRAKPTARKAAERSSMRTLRRSRPARSNSAAARARACDREPGQTTTSRMPRRISSARNATENPLAGDGSGRGLVIVEVAQFALELRDAILNRLLPVEPAQEVGVVVGGDGAAAHGTAARLARPHATHDEPERAADEGHQDD